MKYDVEDLISLPRLSAITGVDENLLRTWMKRDILVRVRPDLALLWASDALPVVAERVEKQSSLSSWLKASKRS